MQRKCSVASCCAILLFTLSVSVCHAAATQYRVIDLGASETSTSPSFHALNQSGDVIINKPASETDKMGPRHVFLVHQGQMKDIGTLGGPNAVASAFNASDQIVGGADVADDTKSDSLRRAISRTHAQHAFLYNLGTMNDLGALPGGTNSLANALNEYGDIVGISDITLLGRHGFVCPERGGGMLDLNSLVLPGSVWEIHSAVAINNEGKILAYGTSQGRSHLLLLMPTMPVDRK